MKERLQAHADRLADDFAHIGLAVASGAETETVTASARELETLAANAPMRVASISKIVTGQLALEVFGGDVDAPIEDALGFRMRPDGSDVTLGQMLAHVSGLSDAGGYVVARGRTLEAHMAGAVWEAAPGERFDYCNLGYICLAAASERQAGRSFGELSRDWLARRGIIGGFNWFGMSDDLMARAVPIYRRGADGFEAQIDAPPECPTEGIDATRFSSQGGLRLSLNNALALARTLPSLDIRIIHRPGAASARFDCYGAGLMILERPDFYPRPLIGHFANAYGLLGGVWHDREANLSIVYLLNGLEFGDDSDDLRPVEREIFNMMAEVA